MLNKLENYAAVVSAVIAIIGLVFYIYDRGKVNKVIVEKIVQNKVHSENNDAGNLSNSTVKVDNPVTDLSKDSVHPSRVTDIPSGDIVLPSKVTAPSIIQGVAVKHERKQPNFEYINLSLNDNESENIAAIKTSISVSFGNQLDHSFAKLTILPLGKRPDTWMVMGSTSSTQFESKNGEYFASVLNIDFDTKAIVINISKKDE